MCPKQVLPLSVWHVTASHKDPEKTRLRQFRNVPTVHSQGCTRVMIVIHDYKGPFLWLARGSFRSTGSFISHSPRRSVPFLSSMHRLPSACHMGSTPSVTPE